MGKIRVKTLGDEEQEKEQQKKTEAKRTKKAAEKAAAASVEASVILENEATPESKKQTDTGQTSMTKKQKTEASDVSKETDEPKTEKQDTENRKPKTDNRKKKEKFSAQGGKSKKARSNKYNDVKIKVDSNKKYSLKDALTLLPELHIATFDETVELHVNTEEAGASGTVTLPHGTGKKLRIAIATDAVLAQVEKGKIDFDILLSVPGFMPKLAKVAKVLGPKGLMPNPKNGTVTQNPEETAKKFEGGHMSYKTEAKIPVIHLSVGKMSFGQEKLMENIKVVFTSLKNAKVKQVVLKSTMSPAIKVDFTN